MAEEKAVEQEATAPAPAPDEAPVQDADTDTKPIADGHGPPAKTGIHITLYIPSNHFTPGSNHNFKKF